MLEFVVFPQHQWYFHSIIGAGCRYMIRFVFP